MHSKLSVFCGVDIPIPQLMMSLRQPVLKDIATFGLEDYLKITGISGNFWKSVAENYTGKAPIHMVFLETIHELKLTEKTLNYFNLFLKQMEIKKDSKKQLLYLQRGQQTLVLEEQKLFLFLNGIKSASGFFDIYGYENKVERKFMNEEARRIAELIKEGEEQVAKYEEQKRLEKNGDTTFEDTLYKYINGLAIITANSLTDIINMTLSQVLSLAKLYLQYEQYHISIDALMAGAEQKEELKHWLLG